LPSTARHAQLLALAGELRPAIHRYCARLMGSVIEGEDVVQDTFARAFVVPRRAAGGPTAPRLAVPDRP
jgi:DNA-directed RNA polymerase specialized sigma24 family protein